MNKYRNKFPGVSKRCTPSCKRNCTRHSWTWQVEYTDADGRRQQVRRAGYDTAEAARDARNDYMADRRKGVAPDRSKRHVTVRQYLDEWLESKDDLRPTTVRSYRQHVRDHLGPTIGHLPLVDLRREDVDKMLRSRSHLSVATQRRVLATLRSAISDAIPHIIAVDPTRTTRRREKSMLARSTAPKVDPWTIEEVDQFVAGLDDPMLAAMVTLASRTGLRLGELCGLRVEDVEVDCLVVRQQAQRIDKATVYVPAKTAAGAFRRVPLVPDARDALKVAEKARENAFTATSGHWAWDGLVFTDAEGVGLVPTTVSKRFHDAVKASGMRPQRFHDLRHTAATHLLRQGVALPLVSKVLGHGSTSITDQVYGHVRSEDALEAMNVAFS